MLVSDYVFLYSLVRLVKKFIPPWVYFFIFIIVRQVKKSLLLMMYWKCTIGRDVVGVITINSFKVAQILSPKKTSLNYLLLRSCSSKITQNDFSIQKKGTHEMVWEREKQVQEEMALSLIYKLIAIIQYTCLEVIS